jgi:S1-C subfamily serine protease
VNLTGSANGLDFARSVVIDKANDVLAAGFTSNKGTGHDFTVAKFSNFDGKELWRSVIHGTAAYETPYAIEQANDIKVDFANNVIVAGGIMNSDVAMDFTVLKLYGSSGKEVWRQVMRPGFAHAVALDVHGNIVAAGSTYDGPHEQFTVMKFGESDGANWWSHVIKSKYYGVANAISTDRSGNVVAAGLTDDVRNRSGFAVVKFDGISGEELWRRVINENEGAGDWAVSVAVDLSDNVVAAGWLVDFRTQNDLSVMKLRGADGSEIWRKVINGAANEGDQALAVTVDSKGDVIGVGYITDAENGDFFVAKLEGATGKELWRQVIAGTANVHDFAQSVAVDADGNVVAAGTLMNSDKAGDFAVMKLDGRTGRPLWRKEIGGSKEGFGQAHAIALDDFGDVAAVGHTVDPETGDDFTVVKFKGRH